MMRWCLVLAVLGFWGAGAARGDEKYLLKENVQMGRVTHFKNVIESTSHMDTKIDGQVNHVDSRRRQVLEGTMTVLEVKDGSATKIRLEFDPDSGTTNEVKGKPEEKALSPFAGKTIVLNRAADGSVENDFKGTANKEQLHDLQGLLDPDQDNYPDHPAAVGDSWEISKMISKRMDLGPKDTVLAHCRLDSVKTENGEQIAQLSLSAALIAMDEFLENDIEVTGTADIDMATGSMLRSDSKGTVKMSGSTTVQNQGKPRKIEMTGTGEINNTSENVPTTQPASRP